MREVEFAHATDAQGLMSFRVGLPLEGNARQHGVAAADGQMGCLMKLYREWLLSGDDAQLRVLWPHARRALEFAWIEGGWDADQDGIMEGCQHNTMDVSYFGPNPQMGGWYLGALRAAEAMARHLGETAFADRCGKLAGQGSRWIDTHLFNGHWYEQDIRPPASVATVSPGLHLPNEELSPDNPPHQLGAGCLIDQLVGQLMAHVCGLGYLLEREHVRTTLLSIMRHNFLPTMRAHVNYMRTYALGDEAAVIMASYPDRDRRPDRPFPYFTEVMTGFEHTLAAHMLYEGLTEPALRIIEAIRDRYDGRKRNPFDEAECGHHYARAMASWAHVLAWTGFLYDGRTGAMRVAAARVATRWFWCTGRAWGTIDQHPDHEGTAVTLRIDFGELTLSRLALVDNESGQETRQVIAPPTSRRAGESLTLRLPPAGASPPGVAGQTHLDFRQLSRLLTNESPTRRVV